MVGSVDEVELEGGRELLGPKPPALDIKAVLELKALLFAVSELVMSVLLADALAPKELVYRTVVSTSRART